MTYAQVIVNTSLSVTAPREEEPAMAESSRERAFTYSVPAHLADSMALGLLVRVPFGSRRLQGLVIGFSETSPVAEPREIEAVVDPRPFLSPAYIELAYWISRTYLCSLNDAVQLMLPPGIDQQTETLLSLKPVASREGLNLRQTSLVDYLARAGDSRLSRLPREMRGAVESLVRRGLLNKRTVLLPPRVQPKRVKSVRLVAEDTRIAAILPTLSRRNPQAEILDYLASHASMPNGLTIPIKDLISAVPCSHATLSALERDGLIDIVPAEQQILLTPKYLEDLPALPQAQSRTMVYLREHGAPVSVDELKMAVKISQSLLRALEGKGYIERTCSEPTVRAKRSPEDLAEQARIRRGTDRYRAIVEFLRQERGSVWISALYAATGCTRQDLKRLQVAGLVALEEEETWRDSLAGRAFDSAQPPTLTGEQQAAVDAIVSCFKFQPGTWNLKPETFLLHGVTGSGKTEIYLRVLAEIVRRGKQGIVLVPEIALTPQTIQRFGSRFPNRIAVLHSRLGVGERYDTWRRCREGLVDLVIGSRSALFAPLPHLGLIVLDEEHEPAYKQESLPFYHAREAALQLAQRVGAIVVLGSATPDLETFHRAVRGEFKLLELPQRIIQNSKLKSQKSKTENQDDDSQAQDSSLNSSVSNFEPRISNLPPVEIVDLRAELKAGNRSIFSRALQRELARVLANREQAILFLNRRGSATFVLCRDCGYVYKCRRCETPMTFHVAETGAGGSPPDQLVCHHCNRRDRVPVRCPQCTSPRIRYFGIGTQRVEQDLVTLFPNARPLRWDYDVTRGRESHAEILETFVKRRADVLIGTQMIAKGLDLPRVTLVGIISADTSLNLPDFRAGERTFQLLTQVAGRAGRSQLGGKVILQTYNPDHYAIQAASKHDYNSFYAQEIAFRRTQGYPPFTRLIRLLYTNTNDRRAQEEAARVHRALALRIAQRGLPSVDLIGPSPAFFHRLRGEYRYHILVKGPDPHALLRDIVLPLGWRVDVDPESLL